MNLTVTIHAAGLALVIAAAALAGAGVARLGDAGTSRYQFASWNGDTVRIDRETGAAQVMLHARSEHTFKWSPVAVEAGDSPADEKEID